MPFDIKSNPHADVVELADALASGASGSNLVRVQVPPSAPDSISAPEQNDALGLLVVICL